MARWIKTPHWLRNREYTRMPPASRLLFHGLFELLQDGGTLVADIPQLKNWLSLDRDYVRRALPAVINSGLVICRELDTGEYQFSLSDDLLDVASTSRQRSVDVVPAQRQRSADVASTSRQRSASVASASRSRSAESSIDAGLDPVKMPVEENRIEKNRIEEKRKEEKKAPAGAASAEPPRASSPTVKRPDDIDEAIWRDWLRVRGKAPLTVTAWDAMCREAEKAGISPGEAVKVCAERGWRGFRADWMERDKVVSMRGGRKEYDLNAMKFEPVYTADGEVSTNPADYW